MTARTGSGLPVADIWRRVRARLGGDDNWEQVGAPVPEAMSRTEWAELYGTTKKTVDEWALDGRLVFDDDGRIDAWKSLTRMADTEKPESRLRHRRWQRLRARSSGDPDWEQVGAPVPETMSRREFAHFMGWRPGYITQLAKDDRLVLTDDTRRVRVLESIQLIEDTKDPARIAQRRRWQEHRAKRDGVDAAAADVPDDAEDVGDETPGVDTYQASRARKEHFQALQAELEYRKAAGALCETDAVKRAAAKAGAYLRTAIERQADKLAPVLAPVTDEAKLRAMLTEHFEAELHELADGMARIVNELEAK